MIEFSNYGNCVKLNNITQSAKHFMRIKFFRANNVKIKRTHFYKVREVVESAWNYREHVRHGRAQHPRIILSSLDSMAVFVQEQTRLSFGEDSSHHISKWSFASL